MSTDSFPNPAPDLTQDNGLPIQPSPQSVETPVVDAETAKEKAAARRARRKAIQDKDEPTAIDRNLIKETRDQIRKMVDEITQLSQTDCSRAEFYQGFLARTTSALASIGGAIWSVDETQGSKLEYQVNLAHSGLIDNEPAQIQHGQLLKQIAAAGTPDLIQPNSGSSGPDQAGNPTGYLLVVGPLVVEGKVVGLVEIFQRPGAGPTTQRGYLRFLVQMCTVASDFLKNDQLRQYSARQSSWHRMQEFVRSVHGSLDTRETVYAIANEGRRVIECDRVSVAIKQGSRLHVQTTSGLDTIERRTDQIKKLSKLTTTVARADQSMWYAGDDSDLPPQIENQLHEYLDVSHSKLVVIEPIREMTNEKTGREQQHENGDEGSVEKKPGAIIGAVIVEQLADTSVSPQLEERIASVVTHSNDALTNAMAHSGMFLAPVWTALGKTRTVTAARNMPKIVVALALIVLVVAALCFVPRPFSLQANGKLVPENRSEIYASIDGVLKEIRVPENPDAIVQAGEVLAVLTSNDLQVEIRNLQGQLERSTEEVNKLKRAQHAEMTAAEQRLIGGQLAEAETLRDSLTRQLELKMNKADLLNVRAPVSGNIFNWQLRQNLLRRPVRRGQNLMTIVHPNTPWQVELEFPERRISHLVAARRQSSEPLSVTFTLASHPGEEFQGRLVSIDNKLDVRSEDGNTMLVRVAFAADQFPGDLLRSGTRVTAQVHAGQRSLGYVWFHELIETAHSVWLLWF